PSSPHPVSEAAVDTGSEITTTDLQEKEVVEQAENGRDAAAIGNAKEENGEQEADNEVEEQEEEGGEEEEEEEEGDAEEEDGDEDEEAESATGQRAAEDDDDDVDTKQQKTHGDDQTAEKEKLNYKKKKKKKSRRDLFTLHFPSQNLDVVTFEQRGPPTAHRPPRAVPPADDTRSPPPNPNHENLQQRRKSPKLPRPCFFS
ncbi:prothymosin alpha-like, partial [Macaca nemestrina]|uniref:prothymosin alpha-like n=1 Tax=Macaca nemestrina TaxID=9545 RepID=UPI0039B8EA01